MGFEYFSENVGQNAKTIIVTSVTMLIVVIATAVIVFFYSLRSPDQVLVPNVIGKPLEAAMLEMQAKELYPKIQLRYSEDDISAGTILEQKPTAGAIVKAGRRIDLLISRGKPKEAAADYHGKNFDAVAKMLRDNRQQVSPVLYENSTAAEGTIIAQHVRYMGRGLEEPIFDFVVSKAKEPPPTIPEFNDITNLDDVYKVIAESSITFDFLQEEKHPNTIVAKPHTSAVLSRVSVDLALPIKNEEGSVYGLFSTKLPEYPYPIQLSVSVIQPDGSQNSLASFKHRGGAFSIPYCVRGGSTIILSVKNREIGRHFVEQI